MSEEYLSDADVGIGAPIKSEEPKYLSDEDVGLSSKPAPKAESSNDGYLTRTEDDGYLTGALKGAATAAIKGGANIVGGFGNLRDFGHYLTDNTYGGIRSLTKGGSWQERTDEWKAAREKAEKEVGLQRYMVSGADLSDPVLERTGRYEPDTLPGRMAQTGLETAISMVGPGSGAGVAKGAKGAEALASTIAAAPINAASGSIGEGVTEVTGSPGLGALAGMAAAPGYHAGKFAVKEAGKIAAPYSENLRNRYAGEQLRDYAENPDRFAVSLLEHPERDRVLPDSPLTTGQVTGDKGILSAERAFRGTDDNFKSKIIEQEEKQNEARRRALGDIPSDGANSLDLVRSVEERHQAITDRFLKAEERLRANAEREAAALGDRADPIELGNRLRAELQTVREAEQAEIGKLYDAVDPKGDMRLLTKPLKEGVKEIENEMTSSTEFSDGLTKTLKIAKAAPEVWSLRELRGLDRRLSDVMSEERRASGETDSWRGMRILKGKVKDAINNAVENQIAWEKAAGIKPEDGIEGRIGQFDAGADVPATDGDAVTGARAVSGEASLGNTREGLDQNAGVGEARAPNGGSGNTVGGQGLAEEAGRDNKIFYPGGNIAGKYEVVDLGDLTTSHDLDFNENPKYPQELQPRDRSAKPAQDQVNNLSSKLNPEQLGRSAEANTGAPIVGPDGIVESGNGRTLAIAKNYASGDPRGYRKWLQGQGYNTEGMKNPVLVARRTSQMTPAEREFFTQNANSSTGLRMRAGEQGAADAKFLTPDVMARLREGSLTSEENADFINTLMSKLPVNERAGFADENSRISQDGLDRLRAAIMHSAYGDADIVKRAFESTDNNIKNITGALTDASGSWSKMRMAAKDGDIAPDHDVTYLLLNTVKKVMKARDEGRPLGEILSQKDLLEGDTPALVESLLIKDGKVVSRKQLTKNLESYAQEALKNESGPGLFGDQVTPDDILRTVGGKEQLPPDATTERAPEQQSAATPGEGQATFASGAKQSTGERPNMTKEAAETLSTANKRYGEYAQTYKKGDVGSTLRTTGFKDQYQIKDSAVAAKAIRPGDTGYETASNFFKATKDSPGSVESMKEMLLNHFRNALGPDGILNSKNYSKIVEKYSGVVRAIEERDPGFLKQVNNAKKASEMLDAFTVKRKQAIDSLNKESAGKFLGLTDALDIENAVGNIISGTGSSVDKIRGVVSKLDAAALDGMRRAAIDWMMRKMTNGESDLSYAKLNRMLKDRAPILNELFTPEQMGILRAVRRDMTMADRSVRLTKDKTNVSGSGRAAMDHIKAATPGIIEHGATGFAVLTVAEAISHGDIKHGALGIIPKFALHIRGRGIESINDVVKQAILDPAFARELLKKIPPKEIGLNSPDYSKSISGEKPNYFGTPLSDMGQLGKLLQSFANSVYRSSIGGTQRIEADQKRVARKVGGRIRPGAMTAEQLITALERSRKEQQNRTKVILNQPDESVVRALHLANQQI